LSVFDNVELTRRILELENRIETLEKARKSRSSKSQLPISKDVGPGDVAELKKGDVHVV